MIKLIIVKYYIKLQSIRIKVEGIIRKSYKRSIRIKKCIRNFKSSFPLDQTEK